MMSKRAYHNVAQCLFLVGFLYLPGVILKCGDDIRNIVWVMVCIILMITGLVMAYLGSERPGQ